MELEYKPGLPVVLNPSCEVAALNSTMPTPAEAVVLSPGGGLAMMTGCKSGGDIRAELDDGRVFRVDSSGTPRLLMEFHKAYFSGKHRIGDALIEARAQFVQNIIKGESYSPVYDLVFYGDPVLSLPLPVRTESPSYKGVEHSHQIKKTYRVLLSLTLIPLFPLPWKKAGFIRQCVCRLSTAAMGG